MARAVSTRTKAMNTAIAGTLGFLMFFPILWILILSFKTEEDAIRAAIQHTIDEVSSCGPGYRLKQSVQVERFANNRPLYLPDQDMEFTGLKVSVFLEVEGAAHYLPAYAGNLDIMTSAAVQAAERIVALSQKETAA